MKGITTYTTTSGIRVCRVHYSAHPKLDPDTPEGLSNVRKKARQYGGMADPKWLQEMEIRFDILGSAKVWPEFLEKVQPAVVCPPFEIPEHWPMRAGYDYGHKNPFAFLVVAYEREDKFYLVDEVFVKGLDVYEQAKLMKEKPYWNRIQQIVGDPSIWRQDQHVLRPSGKSETRSMGDIFEEMDVYIDKGNREKGCDIVFRDLLNSVLWRDLKNPQFEIFSSCREILREMRGMRYKEWVSKQTRDSANLPEEIVDKDNHAWDALKYLILGTHAEAPGRLGYPAGSYGRLMEEIQSMKSRQRLVLN